MKKYALLFLLLLPWLVLPAGAQVPDRVAKKISPVLQELLTAKRPADSIDILVTTTDLNPLRNWAVYSARLLYQYPAAGAHMIRVRKEGVTPLLQSDAVQYADARRTPKEELTTGAYDLSLNKISLTHHLYPRYNGKNILVSIKEQQFDTTDMDIKNRFLNSGTGAPYQSTHASIMATMLAGGGNSSPYAVGAAPGAVLTSSDFAALLPDADAVYQQYGISVQNHSYGTGIENYYGSDAVAYDMSAWRHPSLVHVFSSGNSGTSAATTGSYAGIDLFANLTGSFKMLKNGLLVGATDSFNQVMELSSRGPAYDGRVAPHMVAFGQDGSSGAAALVSGSVALLQQVYKEQYGALPPSSLVKAVLLNSADDMGAPHLDYTTGYGSLNLLNAIKTIQERHMVIDTVKDKEEKMVMITVPANIRQLKVMVVWTDTPATVNAAKALVNDVDAFVTSGTTTDRWLPWVLHPAATKTALSTPAVRGVDTLNNVEQITIDNPEAGRYIVHVKGTHIATSHQAFAIAYQLDTAGSFTWTYPAGADVLPAGNTHLLRWQTNQSGSAKLEYALNGSGWQSLAIVPHMDSAYYAWRVPDTVATALVRLTVEDTHQSYITDTFVLSKPLTAKVGFNCADSFLLFWNALPVSSYQVYQLGAQYLEPAFVATDTLAVFSKNQYASLYYSVAPVVGGKEGLRSYTINYTTQGVGCYVKNFFAELQNGNQALLTAEVGTLYGAASVAFQKLKAGHWTTLHVFTAGHMPSFTFTDSVLTQGLNVYRMLIQLQNGVVVTSEAVSISFFPNVPVIVYPNPARSQNGINVMAQEPGIFGIYIYDATGRLVVKQELDDRFNQLPPFRLSKGLYFVKIFKGAGNIAVQKLVVY